MKKILLSILTLGLLFSCKEDEVILGEQFIAFTDPEIVNVGIPEEYANTGDTYYLKIGIAQPQKTSVTVNLTAEGGTAVEGVNFTIPSSVTIPAGEMYTQIPINVMDDGVDLYTTQFDLVLSSNSANAEIGFLESGSYKKTISILDCSSKFAYWLGDVSIESTGSDASNGTAVGMLTKNASCNVLVIDYDISGLAAYADPGNTKTNFDFTPTNNSGTEGTILFRSYLGKVGTSSGDYDTYFEGTGTYSTITGEINLIYDANAYDGNSLLGSFSSGTTVIKKIN